MKNKSAIGEDIKVKRKGRQLLNKPVLSNVNHWLVDIRGESIRSCIHRGIIIGLKVEGRALTLAGM